MSRITIGATSVAVAALATMSMAPAAQATATPYVNLSLKTTYHGVTEHGTLKCDPPRGDHGSPAEACEVVLAADGDFAALSYSDRVCTQQYDPVYAEVRGWYGDEYVIWDGVYGNPCQLAATAGPVFDI